MHNPDHHKNKEHLFYCVNGFSFKEVFFIGFILFTSCSNPGNNATIALQEIDTIPSPRVTNFSDLPDSLKPVSYSFDSLPKTVTKLDLSQSSKRIYVDSLTGLPMQPNAQGRGDFATFTSDDGLPHDHITCSLQDGNGRLWFGTSSGLSCYDGASFTNFSTEHGLASNRILCILEDRDDQLWIGTGEGLYRYDGHSFIDFNSEKELGGKNIRSITEDRRGHLWFGTWGNGVTTYNGNSFQTYTTKDGLPNDIIRHIFEDKAGNLWFGTWGGGVSRFDGRTFKNYSIADGLVSIDIWSIEEDRFGHLWFAAYEGGVSRYDGNSFVTYNTKNGMPHNDIRTIKKDNTGNLWFGSRGGGVSLYNGTSFVNYTAEHGLANNFVNTITEDNAGVLWFGTVGGGVSKYTGPAFTHFTAKHGLANTSILCIAEDSSGNLWFGSWERGATRYDGSSFTNYTKRTGLIDDNIWSIIEDRHGHLWFGTDFGASHFNGENFTSYEKVGIVNDAIISILEDKSGNLWFGTSESGLVLSNGVIATLFTIDQGLSSNQITEITEDHFGSVWIGTPHGLVCYRDSAFINFTTAQGIMSNNIQCVTVDLSGNVWIGTDAGLNFLSKKASEQIFRNIKHKEPLTGIIFESFSRNDGLPNNDIQQIFADKDGNILVGTNAGIAILKYGPQSFEDANGIEIYNYSTGYPVKNVKVGQQTLYRDNKGIIWIATASETNGLVRFDYKSLRPNKNPPIVTIQSIHIGNEKISWNTLKPSILKPDSTESGFISSVALEEVSTYGAQFSDAERDSLRNHFTGIQFDSITPWYPIPVNLVLPYTHNTMAFDFNSIGTDRNHLSKYQYTLEGYDKVWNPVTTNSFATFGNIHEGRYTFKVKAQSPEGIWSEPISYDFKVLPPIHRTWWAYSMYGLVFLSLVYTGHRYQKQRTIDSERRKANQRNMILNERLRISRDLHDEVGATLSGIVLYSHLAKSQAKSGSQDVENSLNIVQQTASEMVDKLNDVVWLVNPMQDNLEKLVERLEDYGTQSAASMNMAFSLSTPANLDKIILPVDARKNIFLFCKEAINNAVKYSKGTTVELIISQSDHVVEFTIKDDGTGFDPAKINRGNGLDNMQKRADEINAKMTMDSEEEKGTAVSLRYPID